MSGAYARYRAPKASGATLVEPAEPGVGALLRQNARRLTDGGVRIAGRPLAELRTAARQELLATANRYTASLLGEPSAPVSASGAGASGAPSAASAPLILTGHQPGPCHPGVWWKNFALGALSRKTGAVGVHLIIDSDLGAAPTVNVPTGAIADLAYQAVPYDRPAPPAPFENRPIESRQVWDSFAARTAATLGPLVEGPLITQCWPDAVAAAADGAPLGEAWTRLRVRLERRWGLENLEAPLSAVCDGPAMAAFAAHLLADAPRFRDAYNAALARYRTAHKLRNRAHPAPDLAGDLAGDDRWTESPFWVWTAGDPERRAVFSRPEADRVLLTDHAGWRIEAPSEQLAATLARLPAQGVKLRTRALTTTLFARLLLCDLFLHGIGGAKYDGVTDDLFRHYFGLEPPTYLTLSATLHLPIGATGALEGTTEADIDRRLREIEFHPERPLADRPDASDAIAHKLRWIETAKTPANAAERHRGIVAANAALGALLTDERERLEAQRGPARARDRARRIALSREHPYFLFPGEELRETLTRLADTVL
ncbi:hypothetical protein Pla175_01560 [Pirellulimonas nuda]|uniref:Uncharacterized protein n=1 Tax=Pirellulimonas nuda TaxID=2528009 RepID=A0A518D5R0_9BACT|nr:hypothetical protein [Pirellulimonas nuda]QDU86804.1 hypothetical protein Pla175_01560 [Pirellulimonas nuda]